MNPLTDHYDALAEKRELFRQRNRYYYKLLF